MQGRSKSASSQPTSMATRRRLLAGAGGAVLGATLPAIGLFSARDASAQAARAIGFQL